MNNDRLSIQDPNQLDLDTLTPLTKEVISRQATINIGTIGHVAHGKSTVVKAISGVQTVRFKAELARNITIKLGYANAKIFKCDGKYGKYHEGKFKAMSSSTPDCPNCDQCGSTMTLQRHVSFVDCPGHDILMATMLNGAAIMDAALLLIAGNESCPQPQTSEHLAAVDIMNLKNIIILQNKVDLVKEADAAAQYDDIRNFIKGTKAENAPIIPISAQLNYNIDIVCEYIVKKIPVPLRDFTSAPRMIVIRSFDVNKPGEKIDDLRGGVAGGSILRGVFKVGDPIEIRPGIITKNAQNKLKCMPIFSRITTLYAENNRLEYAVPGGLIGIGTKMDPVLTRSDRLVGQVIGAVGTLPQIFCEIEINFFLLRRLLGVKSDDKNNNNKTKIEDIAKNEVLMINIGSTSTGGRVLAIKRDMAKLELVVPVCTSLGEKLAISRRINKHWRLIGWGTIRKGVEAEIVNEMNMDDMENMNDNNEYIHEEDNEDNDK